MTMMAAIQIQLDRDYSPIWGETAHLIAPANANVTNPLWEECHIFDVSDNAGALGYHELTTHGQPIGKVFAKSDLDAGDKVSVTLSHELLEMMGDPFVNNGVLIQQDDGTTVFYCLENADTVEDDSFAYQINGVYVSNFAYPDWWRLGAVPRWGKYDFLGVLNSPLQLALGGYIGVWKSNGGWSQLDNFGQHRKDKTKYHRWEVRQKPHHHRRRSLPHVTGTHHGRDLEL